MFAEPFLPSSSTVENAAEIMYYDFPEKTRA
jgi:hypothetical protein